MADMWTPLQEKLLKDAESYEMEDKRSLFPVLSCILKVLPMWVTRARKYSIINGIGMLLTVSYAVYDIVDEFGFNHIWQENLSIVTVIVEVLGIIYMPVISLSQIMFYFRYFWFFWTNDVRDNKMVYFLVNNDFRSIFTLFNLKRLKWFLTIIMTLMMGSAMTAYIYGIWQDYQTDTRGIRILCIGITIKRYKNRFSWNSSQ